MPGKRLPANALLASWPNQTISAPATPDLSTGLFKLYTLAANVTINNPINRPGIGNELVIDITQDATGGHTITWGSQFWGTIPRVNPAPNSNTLYRFVNTGNAWKCVGALLSDTWAPIAPIAAVTQDEGSPFASMSVKLDVSGRVWARGAIAAIAATANNDPIGTLPPGYAPPNFTVVTVSPTSTNYGVNLEIQPASGTPASTIQSPGALAIGQYVPLNGASWPAA